METPEGSLLVVDDEAMYRDMLSLHLRRSGYTVTDAQDGSQALALLGERPFDLVLLDVLMPGLGGLDTLKAIRQTRSGIDLPVIMATARDQSADVVDALRLGANDYVTKPFDFPVVLARVQTQVSLKRSVDRITRLEQSLAQRNTELESANADLGVANRRMKRELELAARVQQALLPTATPSVPGARFAWKFKPCAELAGDLLNVAPLDDRYVRLYVLDVVDHGAAAALLAVMVNRALARLPFGPPGPGKCPVSPAEVAAYLSREFPWDLRTEQFFSLLYGILDLDTGEFCYVCAGHPGPVLLPPGGEARRLDVPGDLIGLGDGQYGEQRLTLKAGERLYLYTDGLPDACNAAGQRFGPERLLRALEAGRDLPLQEGLAALLEDVERFCGRAVPRDDISILGAELTRLTA